MTKKILIATALAGLTLTFAAPAMAATPAGAIPKGFLLYEKAAAKKDDNPETNWKVDRGKNAKLAVNPCDKAKLATAGRTAARTVVFTSVPDFQKSEQVIVYASPADAEKGMADLRLALRTCSAAKSAGSVYRLSGATVALGDEGLAVTGQIYQGKKVGIGGERAIVSRMGGVIIVYSQSGEWGKPAKADFARQSADAKKMLAKVCLITTCGP